MNSRPPSSSSPSVAIPRRWKYVLQRLLQWQSTRNNQVHNSVRKAIQPVKRLLPCWTEFLRLSFRVWLWSYVKCFCLGKFTESLTELHLCFEPGLTIAKWTFDRDRPGPMNFMKREPLFGEFDRVFHRFSVSVASSNFDGIRSGFPFWCCSS